MMLHSLLLLEMICYLNEDNVPQLRTVEQRRGHKILTILMSAGVLAWKAAEVRYHLSALPGSCSPALAAT